MGVEPTWRLAAPHGLANRPGEPYPATFRFIQWTHRESNSDLQPAELVSSHWTMSPQVERRGIEPRLPGCKPGVFPLDQRPVVSCERSVRELNPALVLTTDACGRNTYRPSSDPGWSRTIALLRVMQASSPLDYGINSDQGGSRTHKHEALDLAALPVCVPSRWRVRGSHPAVQAYEARTSTGSPAVFSSQGESRTRMPGSGTTF